MKLIMSLVCVWGILDGLWLSADSQNWGKTWGSAVNIISGNKFLTGLTAALEVGMCIWLLKRIFGSDK